MKGPASPYAIQDLGFHNTAHIANNSNTQMQAHIVAPQAPVCTDVFRSYLKSELSPSGIRRMLVTHK